MRGNILMSLLLTGLLFTTGCVPEFKNPLPAPKAMKADPALLGTWVSEPDKAGNISQVSFFARMSGWMYIVFIDGPGRYDDVDVSIFEAYSTNVNKDTFLCLRPRKQDLQDQKNREPTYMLAYYQVSQRGILNVNLFDQDAVEGMVEKGLLKGEFKEVNGEKELIKVGGYNIYGHNNRIRMRLFTI
jgi:hypothetical protein